VERTTVRTDNTATSPYVLVTPARDEQANIARTIESVLGQTVGPRHWVIVDDGSTDRTAEIVRRAIAGEPSVSLMHRPPGRPVDFASKARAFTVGVDALAGTPHDFIGNLDADITLPRDYYEQLLYRFEPRPRLGLAGGVVAVEIDGRLRERRSSPTSVAGAVQFFRRQCFDDVGGLMPLRLGGVDSAAEILARMHGWEVANFVDMPVVHHGPVLNRKRNAASAFFSRGRVNHSLGYDPLFQAAVCAHRALLNRPYVIGGALMLAGYLSSAAQRQPWALPSEAVAYLRREQRLRLRKLVVRR
jgi:biofilm PGA synthesis N-glycosyltransferase PgaC